MRLANDDLLLTYRQGTSHGSIDGLLRAVRSSDNGATWSAPSTIYTPTAGFRVSGGMLTRLADDTIACTFIEGTGTSGATPNRSFVMFSTDATATAWTTPVEITSAHDVFCMVESPVVELPNGDLVVPVYGANAADTYWSIRWSKSTDGGATWVDQGELFAGDDVGHHYDEPVLLILDDGSWLMTVRSDGATVNTHEAIWQTHSFDDGATWMPLSLAVFSASARPAIIQRDDKAVFMTYRTTPGDLPRLATSWNRGGSWTGTGLDFTGGDTRFFSYGAWATLPDGQVVLAYSLEDQADDTMASVYFVKLAD